MKKYSLFIDESGNLNVEDINSIFYILCGCAIEDSRRDDLKTYSDQIKFKYWNRSNIVFHSREIARDEGDFEIFKDKPDLKKQFLKDILKFLQKSPITLFPVIVDKSRLNKKEWNKTKIVQITANHVIANYLKLLLTRNEVRGKVIIEFSTVEKDRFYLSSFTYFTSPGCKEFEPFDYKTIQKTLTSLSFVTKHNHDIEEQITDLFTYAVRCKYCDLINLKYKSTNYEKKLIEILEKKLFVPPSNAGAKKKHFFDQIQSFGIIPLKNKK